MALSRPIVPDLERLSNVETMYMKRLKLRIGEDDFIVSSDTEELYKLRQLEEKLCTGRLKSVPFIYMDGLIPTTGEEAFVIRQPTMGLKDKLEIFMRENVLTNVLRPKGRFKTIIAINDAMGYMVLRVKGRSDTKFYELQTREKEVIGSIFKVTCKSPEEWFHHLDQYVMRVPVEMIEELKVAVIAACYFIITNNNDCFY